MRRGQPVLLGLAVLWLAPSSVAGAAITQKNISDALEKGRTYLVGRQQADGLWPQESSPGGPVLDGQTELVFYTLGELGAHPNLDFMKKALKAELQRQPDTTYAVSMHAMGMARNSRMVIGNTRERVRNALAFDAAWLIRAQGSHGGWDYKSLNGGDGRYDFSNTAMALQALRAAEWNIEVPDAVWQKAQQLYFSRQRADGGWNYGDPADTTLGAGSPSYGSMTAAGLASLALISYRLDPGCPHTTAETAAAARELQRRTDLALRWLGREFKIDANPKAPAAQARYKLHWLYQAERAALAWGIKRYGDHDWWMEGVEHLLETQAADGSWGDIESTCYALLFLQQGRPPVIFNKLRFAGDWNSHPQDIANLTYYAIGLMCYMELLWQTVDLNEPLDGLHDAPVLYISLGSLPTFTDTEAKKLRAYTDTGGTILLAEPAKNEAARKWIADLAQRVWPEWPLKPLPSDHKVFSEPFLIKEPLDVQGIDDGLRTLVFDCREEVACAWQERALASRDHLFKWGGANLKRYATGDSPLPSRIPSEPEKPRYTAPVKAGPRTTLKLARLKYNGGDWSIGRHYRGLDRVAAAVKERAGLTLTIDETGVAAGGLGGFDAAYLAASAGMAMSEAERAALKQYTAAGGFLWIEAVAGREDADRAVRKLADDAGWTLTPLPVTDPVISGAMTGAAGYDLKTGVQFSRAPRLRVARMGKQYAELCGIYQDGRLVGLYSPFDVVFSTTGYPAYGCRGYQTEDAEAVATNLMLWLSERDQPAPAKAGG